ncbi:MAG: hypothetical protein B6U78_01155 [Candidatus Aenigmarchaeota archaeon ex4484_224]|nr:MAG: hypothetical protein B6U78_01155 [Candidatus Aenigmarchaeota archaeon ex4484_224]
MEEEMITFELIRKIQREEKENPSLSKIPENFFELAYQYLEKKKEMIKDLKDELEVRAIQRLLNEIYNIRERKIVNFALLAARSNLIPENLTSEEKEFFEKILAIIKERREKKLEEKEVKEVEISLQEKEEEVKEEVKLVKVRFKQELPEFIGIDEKTYGPFKENDEAKIPYENAKLLEEAQIVEILDQ